MLDPRPYCELFRQWSTFHPEFAYLPRKFKIAVSGSTIDRAATLVHDIGVHAVRNDAGEVGFRVLVGGGLGRTPIVGHVIREFVPRAEVLNYFDAIMRVYNRFGRRDNKYKARIKILVKEMTLDVFRAHVESGLGAPQRRSADGHRRGNRTAGFVLRPACIRLRFPGTMSGSVRPSRTIARSPTGSSATSSRTRSRATRQ